MSKIYNISLMAFSLFAFGGYAQVSLDIGAVAVRRMGVHPDSP